MMLSIERLNVFYGDSHILHDVTLVVDQREIVCVLGRNGVGKTTLLRGLMRLTPPRSGKVTFIDVEISKLEPYQIAQLGISYVPQGRQIFPDLTVKENLELGAITRPKNRCFSESIFDVFPVLKDRLRQKGGTLSGGEQQMLAIARGLVAEPRLVLLDEPSEGLQPSLLWSLGAALKNVNKELGVAILMVEQNLDVAFALADRGYIMEKGQIVSEGGIEELQDEALIHRHLAI